MKHLKKRRWYPQQQRDQTIPLHQEWEESLSINENLCILHITLWDGSLQIIVHHCCNLESSRCHLASCKQRVVVPLQDTWKNSESSLNNFGSRCHITRHRRYNIVCLYITELVCCISKQTLVSLWLTYRFTFIPLRLESRGVGKTQE